MKKLKPKLFSPKNIDKYLNVLDFNIVESFICRHLYILKNDNKKQTILRGYHAHKELSQVFIGTSGDVEIELENYIEKIKFTINQKKFLYLPPGYWRVITLNPSSGMIILSDAKYDEDDYIRNYEEFMLWSKNQ